MDSSKSTRDGCISRGPSELADLPPESEPASILKLIADLRSQLNSISLVDASNYVGIPKNSPGALASVTTLRFQSSGNSLSLVTPVNSSKNMKGTCEGTKSFTWCGLLPVPQYKYPTYSLKVVVSTFSFDITEATLRMAFKPYGLVSVEISKQLIKCPWYRSLCGSVTVLYAYLFFENDESIKRLLERCTYEVSSNIYIFRLHRPQMPITELQIIPWVTSNSSFVRVTSAHIEWNKTILVDGIHVTTTAEGLAKVMNDIFDNVIYAEIDTGDDEYPIGSGRVTFSTNESYMKAVQAKFVSIIAPKILMHIEIYPFFGNFPFCNI